jgi:uncharacterized iron-regulated protein
MTCRSLQDLCIGDIRIMKRLQTIVLAVFFSLVPMMSDADPALPRHELQVRVDPGQHRLAGESRIVLPHGRVWTIHVGGIVVNSVSVQGAAYREDRETQTITVTPEDARNMLTVMFDASYAPGRPSGKEEGIEQANMIDPDGIALTGSWYPSVAGLSEFRLTATLPPGFEGISEADEVRMKELPDGLREVSFIFEHPVDSISLIAGKYRVKKVRHKEVDVVGYFFPEDEELGGKYLEYTKKYLDMYEGLIGPYPFRRFAVVENVLPTGYSMPTFTLLGRDVVKLPFIVDTSLGHEILHQWFGNSVYIDHTGGNWAEGLTTYLADHRYEEEKGAGREYRKQILAAYRSYITPENDFSLKDFTVRSDKGTSSVGYGKSAMVFHMLKQELGPDVFATALREFYAKNLFVPASWTDIRKACEAASGKDLGGFFDQWIEGKGALDFRIMDALVRYEGTNARISFDVRQMGRKDGFLLPVVLITDRGKIRQTFRVEKESESFEIVTREIPRELVADGDYDLFRTLADDETAPVITMLLGDKNRLFVTPQGKGEEYKDLLVFLKTRGFAEKREEDMTYEDLKGSSLLVPGDTALVKRLFARSVAPEGDFSLVMKFNPYRRKSVIGIVHAASPADMQEYLRRVMHYGKYTKLVFKDGKNVEKTAEEGEQGMREVLYEEVRGIAVPQLEPLSRIIAGIEGKDIIYVGEIHDRFENHRLQLQVIRELHLKNRKLAIGMEMFQQPFQNVLDEYIAGTTDEKTFLKKSEYFKRWAFDFNLYREILLFARENRIPVIALNIRKEIVSKVAKQGLNALTEDDLKEVPSEIDLSDREYRERLREVFVQHGNPEGRNFDFFYQSQVLWDESMAHNLNAFMEKNPGYQIVVLAGIGHMAFGSGIPKRTNRLNHKEYAVILPSYDIEQGIADFVLFPSPVEFIETPKLGVQLREEGGLVTIAAVSPQSPAERAGLREDDVIVSLDTEKVETVEDMKIHLLYKKKGDIVKVGVVRKRFLLGPKEFEVSATL